MAQALYLTLVQQSGQHLTATETVHLNSYNNLPIMLACSFIFGEFSSALSDFEIHNIYFLTTFLTVIALGCVLNYLLFLCTTMNSALTTSVVAAFKSNLSTVIGLFTFGGISINFFTVLGMSMNMLGGSLYTYIRYKQGKQKSKERLLKPKHVPNGDISHVNDHITLKIGNGLERRESQ